MLSKKSKYALQALIYLTRNVDRGAILISEIAQIEKIPQKFLEAILLQMKNRGILQSKKGKGGGYQLGRKPEEITFGEVIRMLDGPLAPVSCVSVMAYRKCDECKDEETCGIKMVMKDVRDAMADILESRNLADVVKSIKKAEAKKV